MPLEPTPKDAIFRDGTATVYRFRGENGPNEDGKVVLFVPSLINRWYVMDLRDGASVASAFVDAGFDTYILDWGIPNAEDRYMTWHDVLKRLHRAVRKVKRYRDTDELGILGYCMGATLCGIYLSLHPDEAKAFANLAGPFDFSHAGTLGDLVDPEHFDVDAIVDAGNVTPVQMQSGFIALRPTGQVSKWITLADRMLDPDFRESFKALGEWAGDNISFPAEAYRTYIKELYQQNLLVQGEHFVAGKRADLGNIECPVLTIAATRDHICPEPAAMGLNENVGSKDKESIVVRGGHVGAVVGSRAARDLYPQMTKWFDEKLGKANLAAAE